MSIDQLQIDQLQIDQLQVALAIPAGDAMNPGVAEEMGQTARGFIESMKTQPLALALAVMNIMLMALFFYVAQWAGSNRQSEFNALLEANKEVQKLLYQCTPMKLQSDTSRPVELPKE